MAKYPGRLVQLGVGREVTRGAGITPAYRVPHVSFSFDDKVIKARSDAGLGRLEDSEEAFVTTRYGQGDLEGEIRGNSFPLFLYSMLGTLSTSGPTDSAYTHSFSLAQNAQHQSLSFLVVDSNTTELYKLVMMDSLEIVTELDAITRFSASFMGKQAVDSTLTVPTMASESKFTKKHLSFKVAANLAGLSGASTISVKSLTLTISKNIILDDVLGTAEPEDILNKQISVEGSVVLNYEDETWKNYMKTPTDRAVEIKWINNDVTIGASTNPGLTIQMPKVDFFDWEPDYSLDEIVSQTISFKGSYDSSGGNDIISTCDFVNTIASY